MRCGRQVAELDAAAWDALDHGPSPFLRHGFLRALEDSGSIDPAGHAGSGASRLDSVYLLAEQAGALVGARRRRSSRTTATASTSSTGAGRTPRSAPASRYYPKLVDRGAGDARRPGTRILLAPGAAPRGRARADRARCARSPTTPSARRSTGCSAPRDEQALLADAGFFARASFQFHWHNRGYATFDDFLGALKSRKRKQLRKERAARAGGDRAR